MRCIIYCRKSTEDKNKQVQSIEDQLHECMLVVESRGFTVTAPPFKESKTGRKPGVRVEFYKMIDLIKGGKADTIVCWDASRLCRNAADGGQLIHLVDNIGLKIVTPYTQYDTTNSFLLFIEFGMATDYSKKLSHNVKRGLMSKVAKGLYPGPAPVGYLNRKTDIRSERDIIIDPSRFDLCRKWWDLFLTGEYTVEKSLAKVTGLGLTDRRGKSISLTAAYRFFRNPFYLGKFNYAGEVYQGTHQGMISEDEFNRAEFLISGGTAQKHTKTPAEFAGFIRCGECGATITHESHTKHYKNGKYQTFSYYRCTRKKGKCSQKFVEASQLDKQARQYILDLDLDPDYIEWIRAVLKRRNAQEFEFAKKGKELQTKRLTENLSRRENLFAMKLDGLITPEEYQSQKGSLLTEESQIKKAFGSDRIPYWEKIVDQTLDFAKIVMELFSGKDPFVRRMVLQILGSNLVLKDQKLGITAKGAFLFLKQAQDALQNDSARLVPKDAEAKPRLDDDDSFSLGEAGGTRTHDP